MKAKLLKKADQYSQYKDLISDIFELFHTYEREREDNLGEEYFYADEFSLIQSIYQRLFVFERYMETEYFDMFKDIDDSDRVGIERKVKEQAIKTFKQIFPSFVALGKLITARGSDEMKRRYESIKSDLVFEYLQEGVE